MKNEIFIYHCKCLFQIYGIPVRIYKNDTLQLKYELTPLNPHLEPLVSDILFKQLAESNEPYKILQSPNMMAYCLIRNKNSDLSLLIGPSRSTEIRKEMFTDYMRRENHKVPLPDRIYKSLEFYLNAIPIMQTGRFLYIVSSIYAAAQEEIISPEEMKIVTPVVRYDPYIHKNVLKHFENVINGDIKRSNYYDYEKRILMLIVNGMSEELAKIWQDATIAEDNDSSGGKTLRTEKNRLIAGIGIVTHAVLDTGFDKEDIYRQRALYLEQAEACRNVKEVINLRFNMMMDFCRRIEQMKYKSSNIPIVNYAIKYVNDNIDKKISLEEIAVAVHASESYLCAEFKKSMGIGLFHYIQAQKVERAKQFLLLTDKPLVEISSMLSFSSQSYFQKVFKEITGITPKQFRNQSK